MISQDNQQRLQSWIAIGANGYKVLMASMLCIFVPQKCPDGECTLKDNFTDLIPFNTAVLVINFMVLAIFIGFYILEYIRENWCIEYLDFDESKAMNALSTEIEQYPEFKERLSYINKVYYQYTVVLVLVNVVNFVCSSVLIFHYYYLDFKSVTVMITYAVLIADKIAFTLTISKQSFETYVPCSAYRTGPVVYNVIDADYQKSLTTKSIELATEPTSSTPSPSTTQI